MWLSDGDGDIDMDPNVPEAFGVRVGVADKVFDNDPEWVFVCVPVVKVGDCVPEAERGGVDLEWLPL